MTQFFATKTVNLETDGFCEPQSLRISDGVFLFFGFGFELGVCTCWGFVSSEVLESYYILLVLKTYACTHVRIFLLFITLKSNKYIKIGY